MDFIERFLIENFENAVENDHPDEEISREQSYEKP